MKTVQTDADRRELAPHGTLLCPMEVHHDDPSLFPGGVIPCHWHEEIELSAVQQGRVMGTQFHPEKSGRLGLSLLKNFAMV